MARRTGEALALAALAALAVALPRPATAAGDVRVEASVDRAELGEDETLTLTVRVEADEAPSSIDVAEAELPFRVVSRARSSAASFSLGGGGLHGRRATELRLALAPRRTGELVLPPVVAVVRGVRHATRPISVTVHPAAAGPRPPPPDRRGGTWSGWERDLVLQVEVDRREVFLGEQATVTVWLLSPAGVVAYEGFRPPAYDGFWVEELETPQRLAHRVRSVNGVPTRAYLLQRLALFPTRAGPVELGPYQVDVALRLGSDSLLSPFGDVRRARRRSAPVALRVKPLPPGAPAGFDGVNVGSLRLEARAPEARVAAGEPVAIRIAASGEGNVRALSLPSLPDLPGVRRFAPTSAEDVRVTGGRLGGTRTLETVVVPEGPGELVVPPLAWPFFDPRSGRYEVARTEALRVEVIPGTAPVPPAPADPLAAALGPPRRDGVPATRPPAPWRRAPFLLLLALPPLAFGALAAGDARRRRAEAEAPGRRRRGAAGRAAGRLRAARGRLGKGDRAGFLGEVERALAGFAADRLARPTGGMTRDAVGEALAGAGVRPAAVTALAEALDACDAARFGGGAVPDAEVLARAERALALVDAPEEERP